MTSKQRKIHVTSSYREKNLSPSLNNEQHKIDRNKHIIGVVGLGYVGLPVAVGFSDKFKVIGFDIDDHKIKSLQKNIDMTGEITEEELKKANIHFTSKSNHLSSCDFIIVAVPTPLTPDKKPDLTFLEKASMMIGTQIKPQTTIIYESTVFPGATEDVCIPLLEKASSLTAGVDFHVGYSPERINPGDREHTFKQNNKIVSGQNEIALSKIFSLYKQVIKGEVFKVSSIKVAEAAKVVENTQRDINIALMNELSLIFDTLNIDTQEVLQAASTKWNFLPFEPGLVGGHCIGVDPYYLIYRANNEGLNAPLISAAREINDYMPIFIVSSLLNLLVKYKYNLKELHINVFGITFKENTPDLRNSKALEIVDQLQGLGISIDVYDPLVTTDDIHGSNISLKSIQDLKPADVCLYTVAHEDIKKNTISSLYSFIKRDGILLDIKGIIPQENIHEDTIVWRL